MSDQTKGPKPAQTQIHDLPVAGPKPTHEEPNRSDAPVPFAELPPHEQVAELQRQLDEARAANRTPTPDMPDFEARKVVHDQLTQACNELDRLRAENEIDEKKMVNSVRRWDAEKLRCQQLGLDFDPDVIGLVLYKGDAALKERLHKKHYQVAALEKHLGIRQPEPKPAK